MEFLSRSEDCMEKLSRLERDSEWAERALAERVARVVCCEGERCGCWRSEEMALSVAVGLRLWGGGE